MNPGGTQGTRHSMCPYSITPRDFLGWDPHKTKKQRKHKENKHNKRPSLRKATEPMCANGANRKPGSTGCINTTRRRNETAVTERARDEQRGDKKKTVGVILHRSRPVRENAEGTNRAKQRIYVKTSRKVGKRYNQEGARDGTSSDSHLVTNV